MSLHKSMYSPLSIFSDNRDLVSHSKSPNSTPDPRGADLQGTVAESTELRLLLRKPHHGQSRLHADEASLLFCPACHSALCPLTLAPLCLSWSSWH